MHRNTTGRVSPSPMQGSRTHAARTAIYRYHRTDILLHSSHQNIKRGKGRAYHQPDSFHSIHLCLYLPSTQAVLHHAMHLHARLFDYGKTHHVYPYHPSQPAGISLEQKTLSDAMAQTVTKLCREYLSPDRQTLQRCNNQGNHDSGFDHRADTGTSCIA